MSFISLPRATVAIRGLGFHFCPAIRTNQHPVVGGIVHDAVQRRAHHLTQRARFDAGSDGSRHCMIVSVCGDADQSLGTYDTSRYGQSLVSLRDSNMESAADLKNSPEFALVERQLSVSADLRCRDASVRTQSQADVLMSPTKFKERPCAYRTLPSETLRPDWRAAQRFGSWGSYSPVNRIGEARSIVTPRGAIKVGAVAPAHRAQSR